MVSSLESTGAAGTGVPPPACAGAASRSRCSVHVSMSNSSTSQPYILLSSRGNVKWVEQYGQ
eukprot:3146535-Alexandrium_andersonii.AAC.1